MQDRLYGFPKGGLEPHLWRPALSQTGYLFPQVQSSILALRKPFDTIPFVIVGGQLLVAQGSITFDSGGTASTALTMKPPIEPNFEKSGIATNGPTLTGVNIGTFHYFRVNARNDVGVIMAYFDQTTVYCQFKVNLGAFDNAYGANPAMTVTAGDQLAINLSYFI